MKTLTEKTEELRRLMGIRPWRPGFGEAAPKAPKKLKGKALDREIERVYYEVGQNVQIDMMDIGKIFKIGRDAYEAGEDLHAALKAAVEKYRKN